jgi:hypothetical protein
VYEGIVFRPSLLKDVIPSCPVSENICWQAVTPLDCIDEMHGDSIAILGHELSGKTYWTQFITANFAWILVIYESIYRLGCMRRLVNESERSIDFLTNTTVTAITFWSAITESPKPTKYPSSPANSYCIFMTRAAPFATAYQIMN